MLSSRQAAGLRKVSTHDFNVPHVGVPPGEEFFLIQKIFSNLKS